MPTDKFLMTISPTADELVGAHFQFTPASADELDVVAAEVANAMLKKQPKIVARIWKGHTDRGYPVEVAILRFVRMDPEEVDRLDDLIKNTTLPTELPEPGVTRGDPKRD